MNQLNLKLQIEARFLVKNSIALFELCLVGVKLCHLSTLLLSMLEILLINSLLSKRKHFIHSLRNGVNNN